MEFWSENINLNFITLIKNPCNNPIRLAIQILNYLNAIIDEEED